MVPPVEPAADTKPRDGDAVVEQRAEIAQACALGGVVLRDLPAHRHAAVLRQPQQHGIEHVTTDVVEIHIDALGRSFGQGGIDGAGLVVDAGIEPQILDHVPALFRPARDADGAAPHDLGDLPDDAADGASRSRHRDRLTGLHPRDIEEADPGCRPRLANQSQRQGKWLQVRLELAQAPAVEHRVLAPAEFALHGIADLEIRMAALDNDADTATDHEAAELQRVGIVGTARHLPAKVRIHGKVMRARQHLALIGARHGRLHELEATLFDGATWRANVTELFVHLRRRHRLTSDEFRVKRQHDTDRGGREACDTRGTHTALRAPTCINGVAPALCADHHLCRKDDPF